MARPTLKRLLNQLGGASLDLWRARVGVREEKDTITLCHRLMELRGEATGIVIADEIFARFNAMDEAQQLQFFEQLLTDFQPDTDLLRAAAQNYLEDSSPTLAAELAKTSTSPRLAMFRSLSTSPSGVASMVKLRAVLIQHLKTRPHLKAIDDDLLHLFRNWFNRGFLELREIDWQTPAHILEKLIAYEAVHEIQGWDDLRRRLAEDRRCFAFFHPALTDEPLVFVQVALTPTTPTEISSIIGQQIDEETERPSTAVFYSISNCQNGLRGVSFGNFLIKQVLLELKTEFPSITHSVTLSPVPNFKRWLDTSLADTERCEALQLSDAQVDALIVLSAEVDNEADSNLMLEQHSELLMRLCAFYLVHEKRSDLPLDPVARFHLSNGALLEQVNWAGDNSALRLKESFGILVNYVYHADKLELNHEALINDGVIAASTAVKKLSVQKVRSRAA